MAHRTSLDSHLVSLTAPGSFAAEQYQGLRLTVERLARTREAKVIAVTSPAAGDGKTTTSINLAGALATGTNARVVLVDADFRRPAVSAQLGLADTDVGLADALVSETKSFDSVIRRIEGHNLSVIPAGLPRPGVHQILRSSRLDAFLQEMRARFDYIVVDTPPLLPVFDSAVLARAVDGVLVVVAAKRTPRKLLAEALNMLDADKVLGIVFNRDERPLFGYYESYYHQYFPDASEAATGA